MSNTKQSIEAAKGFRRFRSVRLRAAVLGVSALAISTAFAGAACVATGTVASTTKTTQFGTILASGDTVYTFKPIKVPGGASCLTIWSAVLLPKP